MEVEGKVLVLQDLQEFASGFTKRVLVVETDENYPQQLPIEFCKDKIDLINSLNAGDSVKVGINLRGNEYNGKYYSSIQGWKIEVVSTSEAPPANVPDGFEEDDGFDAPF